MAQQEQKQQQHVPQSQTTRRKRTDVSGRRVWDEAEQAIRTQITSLIEKFTLPLIVLSNDYISIPFHHFIHPETIIISKIFHLILVLLQSKMESITLDIFIKNKVIHIHFVLLHLQ